MNDEALTFDLSEQAATIRVRNIGWNIVSIICCAGCFMLLVLVIIYSLV